MKAKTIKKVLRTKIDSWILSIDNSELRELVSQNVIVTGGSIVSMLLREDVNDYDIYFRNQETAWRVANYYVDNFKVSGQHKVVPTIEVIYDDKLDAVKIYVKSDGAIGEDSKNYEYFEPDLFIDTLKGSNKGGGQYRPVFLSQNAITLSGDVQLITRFFGEPEVIHSNYDFVHCTGYWTSWDNKLVLPQAALLSIIEKDLKYVGSLYPLASVIRTRKFIKRGWTITAGQYLKMIMQLNELNLTDPEVLQEQLTGVDAAYFDELLTKLREAPKESIDSTYIATLVDELL